MPLNIQIKTASQRERTRERFDKSSTPTQSPGAKAAGPMNLTIPSSFCSPAPDTFTRAPICGWTAPHTTFFEFQHNKKNKKRKSQHRNLTGDDREGQTRKILLSAPNFFAEGARADFSGVSTPENPGEGKPKENISAQKKAYATPKHENTHEAAELQMCVQMYAQTHTLPPFFHHLNQFGGEEGQAEEVIPLRLGDRSSRQLCEAPMRSESIVNRDVFREICEQTRQYTLACTKKTLFLPSTSPRECDTRKDRNMSQTRMT